MAFHLPELFEKLNSLPSELAGPGDLFNYFSAKLNSKANFNSLYCTVRMKPSLKFRHIKFSLVNNQYLLDLESELMLMKSYFDHDSIATFQPQTVNYT